MLRRDAVAAGELQTNATSKKVSAASYPSKGRASPAAPGGAGGAERSIAAESNDRDEFDPTTRAWQRSTSLPDRNNPSGESGAAFSGSANAYRVHGAAPEPRHPLPSPPTHPPPPL